MEKHTPEPWEVIDAWIADASGLESIAFVVSKKPAGLTLTEHDKANAARIVACVNACAGINPDAVPDLLEVSKSALAHLDAWHGGEHEEIKDKIRKTIAKAGKV